MKTVIIQILISSLFLLSCTTKEITNLPVTESSTSTTSISEQSIHLKVTQSAIPIVTNSYTVDDIPLCPKGGSEIESANNFSILGTIVYQKDFHGLYTVGGNPLIYSTLPVDEMQRILVFGFSPDGQWLAFSPLEFSASGDLIAETPKVVLLSANGERIGYTLSVEGFSSELQVAHVIQGFSGYSHWINNKTIYAALYTMNPDPHTSRHINDLPKVIDPFEGVWREDLLENLPEMTNSYAKGISPDLTRILYLSGEGLFLKDMEKGIDIWHDKDLFAVYGALMFWSPDSKTVAYANLFDSIESRTVVLISRDGLVNTIMGSGLPLSGLLVEDIKWSPDGHLLAVLVWEGENKGDWVYIYDHASEKFISRCPIANSTDMHANLIWSPDDKYLAYSAFEYPLIIMDVQSGEIIKLAENANAVGWSDKFPAIWSQP